MSRLIRFRVWSSTVITLTTGAAGLSGQAMASATRAGDRSAVLRHEGGREVLHVSEGASMGLLSLPTLTLDEGTVEFDARGRDVLQRSFLGLAFRVQDDTTYDVVYLRPFNFRAADSTRHAHAVQYVSEPAYPWERLRREHPGAYEAPISPPPDPTAWVHVRVEISHPTIRVFIDRASTPALVARELSGRSGGGLGLWVGLCSDGDFAALKVTPRGGTTHQVSLPAAALTVTRRAAADSVRCRPLR